MKSILTAQEWKETQEILKKGREQAQIKEEKQKKVKVRLKLKRNIKNIIKEVLILLLTSILFVVIGQLITTFEQFGILLFSYFLINIISLMIIE